jgi:tetratricopeptide (TPR) repeat protein
MDSISTFESLCKQGQKSLREKDYKRSREFYQQALELNETNVLAHEGLAATCFFDKDYEGAIENFKRITELDPLKGSAFINLGALYNRIGDYDKAISILRKGLQKERSSSEGYYDLGIAHRKLKQLSLAVSAYREAIRLNPEMAEAYQNLANVYVEMGNNQQAISHYKKSLELRPDFDRAKRGLANAEAALEKANNAISPFGRLVDNSQTRKNSSQIKDRKLSEEEREKDRSELEELMPTVIENASKMLEQIRDTMEPSLHALNRAVAQGTEFPSTLVRALSEYQEALEEMRENRRRLKRSLLELRAHEELMHSPKLELSD